MLSGDTELAQRAAAGDVAAFHLLVDRHSDALMRLAVWLCRNRADAEDSLQEAFIAAFRGIRGFDGRASFKTWITRILMRHAVRIRQKSAKHRGPPLWAAVDEPNSNRDTAVPSPAGQVEQRIDLAASIESLPEDQRQVIVLREVQGLAYDEIAEVLGIPRGTVESRLHRARLALRQRLGAYARES